MRPSEKSLSYRLLFALIVTVTRLPLAWAIRTGRAAGRIAFYFSRRRHTAYADLKAAFTNRFDEKERWRIVQNHFAHLAQVGVEMLYFPTLSKADLAGRITVHHKERYDRLIAENRGVVLLTAHFGNWELLQVIGTLEGRPVHVLQRPQKHPLFDQILSDLRQSRGSLAVSRGMGVRGLIRALRARQSAGLLGDQDAGKYEGRIERLFGRKTTVPAGPFELAARTDAALLPVFIVSRGGGRYEIFVEEPAASLQTGEALQTEMRRYLDLLESFAGRFPEQWLWGAKRWKYSWTKRLVVLSDGKPGHVKQSQAVAARFLQVENQYGRPGMEYLVHTLAVEFKSAWHRRLFPFFAFFFIPFAQGRLRKLGWFLTAESTTQLREASADFFISCGASLAPLNLCLARECRAKSIVLMKPPFPFQFHRYDLALVPAHDRGAVPRETFRTLLVPSLSGSAPLQEAAEKLRASLKNAERVKIAVFLGGATRHYRMGLDGLEKVFSALEKSARRLGDYAVTTSRRTPGEIVRFLKERRPLWPACQLLIDAAEDTRPEVVPGMMHLADILIVTEDSISMISEAVASGKKVIVLGLSTPLLPAKHRRFLELLLEKSAITMADPAKLEEIMTQLETQPASALAREQDEALTKKLETIL